MRNLNPENRRRYTRQQRVTALVYGLFCHLLFAAAIISMAVALFNGLTIGIGPFRGWTAAVANLLLLLSFPLAHSFLLTPRGRRVMTWVVPFGIGKELSTTVYAIIASAQLLAVFVLWSPSGVVWWNASGIVMLVIGGASAVAWLLLGKAMADGQLALQTGFLGWNAVFRNRAVVYKPFATRGVYRHVRQPIYISSALIPWLTSVWTPDQLVFAVLWTGYCLAGAALKERRCEKILGDEFRSYQERVPFWLPFLKPSKRQTFPTEAAHGTAREVDVLIAGGGPVGLVLANLLGKRGLRVLVAERRSDPPLHSMAIGITPPSLAILRQFGLDETFTREGVPIDTARVFENGEKLGDVDFSRIPADHRFILSLPQSATVRILEENLRRLPSVKLVRGVEAVGLRREAGGVRVTLRDMESGGHSTVTASFLAGCDGHRSAIRRLAGIRKRERRYRPRFIMADFEDHTDLCREAHLYFGREGSVESFPLPDGRRRWIVLDKAPVKDPSRIGNRVVEIVRQRTGFDLSGSAIHFQSAFQPGRLRVDRYTRNRVLLCGDAAHVMSPIGGQGMNTGFADAAHLDRALACAFAAPTSARREFARYQASRRRAFRIAADRAALGMWLGTRTGAVWSLLRRGLIAGILLRRPVRERLAPYFAMLTIPGSVRHRRELAIAEGDTP